MGTIMISTIKGRKSTKGYLFFTFLLLVVAISAVSQLGLAEASTITVNTFTDELNTNGNCSLREAIQAANQNKDVDACPAGSGDDVIILPAGTYTLTIAGTDEYLNATGDLNIFTTNLTGESLTIRGAGASSTIIDGGGLDRVFYVGSELSQLRLEGVTVQNGRLIDKPGAGFLIWGTLYLENAVVRNNTITGSSSQAAGGGLAVGAGLGTTGQATIVNTIIENNSAPGGGGIFSNRPLTITASSIISNTARAGGGIMNYGALTLTNSTLSGNSASNNSGAISQESGTLNIVNSTISHNTAPSVTIGGIWAKGGTSELKNTIVAYNTGGNCNGTITSSKYSISSDDTCGLAGPGDKNNTDPKLSALGNYGGPTPVHMPIKGSPAIDGVVGSDAPASDQRGLPRPIGGGYDIGAVEKQTTDPDLVSLLYLPLILK